MEEYKKGAEEITLFCRINMNTKRALPIRPSEMGMLIYIVTSSDPVSPIMIAEYLKVTKPLVTSMIRSMVVKGYLIKSPSQTDKRSFTLIPTQKAIRLVNNRNAEYYKTMELLKKKMGEQDYTQLIQLVTRANEIMLYESDL